MFGERTSNFANHSQLEVCILLLYGPHSLSYIKKINKYMEAKLTKMNKIVLHRQAYISYHMEKMVFTANPFTSTEKICFA